MRDMLNIFKALSDETRIRILKLLEGGELCICKIMEILDMKQSRISRHMAILKNAGLVIDRREGKWVYYSLNARPENLCCKGMISFIAECLKGHGTVIQDQEKLKSLQDKVKKKSKNLARQCNLIA